MHIALIPDGNRRWAKEHGLPALEGHRRGAEAMHTAVEYLIDHQVNYLTVWGFSTDNWKRSDSEVNDIFNLLKQWLDSHTTWAHSKDIRLRYLGRFHELPASLRETIRGAVALTVNNRGMNLNVAFNYTGRTEILDAICRLIDEGISPHLVDESMFSKYLYTNGIPDVDLVIRTAGEFRMSNFLLWQTAYSEYYFTKLLWPDFDVKELERAFHVYSERRRRFGGD